MTNSNWTTSKSFAEVTNAQQNNINGDEIDSDDSTWILTSAFIIFTMQSGFGLLESGMVSRKNEVNIMVKNAIDVIYGGLSYWLFGFAFSFGLNDRANGFCGLGSFLTDADENQMGQIYSKYFFQLSFATTATTIVSGAMAERTSLKAYTMYSFLNTLTYSLPAHWIWDHSGWLNRMGAVDIAGCGPVHLVGGVSGLVATLMLKPRIARFDENAPLKQMASPTNVLLGTFMLWWGWLGFNCGSTFGISGMKWKLASRAAVVTINGSIGGGIIGMAYSYICFKNKLNIPIFVTGILAGLVSITAVCSLARPWEAILIGALGALLACPGCALLDRLRIDDPVGCVPTHCFAGIWGLISVALFAEKDILENQFSQDYGVFKGGPWSFLGVQMLVVVSVSAWAAATTFLELLLVDKVFGLRVSTENELLGADYVEHGVAENDFTLQGIYDEKENGSERLKSVEVNVLNDLPITLAIDTFQNNDNGHKSFWKRVPVKRKIFRRKLRKALSIKGSRNESPRNGTFTVQLSYVNGGQNVVDSNGATESRDHIRVVENGGVITDTESHLQRS
ncbi:putative ammonium transporter 3 [Montipora foliosa]|uniref:putative ammonium transporter 3 n=1 Tax=Montipora foliosa TaxID=591990 RepID=UPI0035F1C192